LFDACRKAQNFGLVKSRAGTTATSFGLPSVKVPVLSTTSVSTRSIRSAPRHPDQDAGLRAAADADHDRHRVQAKRARAGDDEHAHGCDKAEDIRGSGPNQARRRKL